MVRIASIQIRAIKINEIIFRPFIVNFTGCLQFFFKWNRKCFCAQTLRNQGTIAKSKKKKSPMKGGA